MKRSMRISTPVALTLALAGLAGCNFIFPPKTDETGSSELKRFSSEQEFTHYMRGQMTARNSSVTGLDRAVLEEVDGAVNTDSGGAPPTAAPDTPGGSQNAGADDTDAGFSGTTLQEAGVDEADVVKTDGNHLYLLDYADDGAVLRIIDVTNPGSMAVTGELKVDGYGQELYLNGDRVVALTSGGGGFYYFGGGGGIGIEPFPVDIDFDGSGSASGAGSAGSTGSTGSAGSAESSAGRDDVVLVDPIGATEPGVGTGSDPDDSVSSDDTGIAPDDSLIPPDIQFERPYTLISVIDVSDPQAPTLLSKTRFDGYASSSRLIDGVLHLVMANYQDYFVDVLPLLGRPQFDAGDVEADVVIPRYTRTDADGSETSGDVVTWENLYRPTDPDGFGIVYVVSLDLDADAAFSAVGVVAQPGLIYSSREALYLTDTNYNFLGDQRETTDLYKFAYSGRGATPVATGTVPGRVLNQYSMGEHAYENEGYLRVATTVGPTFTDNGTSSASTNGVYVLKQSGGSLSITGRVENVAPNETIQAARFIGNRGYLVTFEQIDPLFTLDLADPNNPRIVGELKVPGFSTFIVPIDDNHLLTVGQHVPPPGEQGAWGVQLSIFDVTDFSNPTLMNNVIIGDETGAYSEALYNPKAFTYYAQRGVVALPISIYDDVIIFEGDGTTGVDADVKPGDETGDDASSPPDASDDGTDTVDVIDVYVPGGFEGVVIYNVSVESGLSEAGRISTRFEDAGYYWASFTRGVFVKEDVLAVTDHGVRGAPVNNLTSASFELLIDAAIDYNEPPVSIDGGGVVSETGEIAPGAPLKD